MVVSNFEHLLPGAPLLSEILQNAPQVRILATSRSKLDLQEETIFRLEGMDFPDWETPQDALQYSAVKLFLQSARRVQPDFTVKPDDLLYLARICRQVQGMPLGILLAAAWVDTLSLAEISAEIAHSLDFLETNQRNTPERQRSLRAVFDYSWGLMTDEEREGFPKLSVFRGGFTRDAAQKVGGASLRTLAALVNKSMLRRNADSGRYEIHELLRQYAAERLENVGLTDTTQNAHSDYFADYMDERWIDLKGRRHLAALKDMDVEINNLRVAWHYLANHQKPGKMLNFASSLVIFGESRERIDLGAMFGEALQVLRAYPADDQRDVAIGHILGLQAWLGCDVGLLEKGKLYGQEAISILEHYPHGESLIWAWAGLGRCCLHLFELQTCQQAMERVLTLALDTGNRWALPIGYLGKGYVYQRQPEPDLQASKQMGEEGLRIAQELGNVWMMEGHSGLLSYTTLALKEYAEAKHYALQRMAYRELTGNSLADAVVNVGQVSLAMNDYTDAHKYYRQSLRLLNESGASAGIVVLRVHDFVDLFMAENQKEKALELLSLIIQHPAAFLETIRWAQENRAKIEADLPPDVYAAAWERGKTLDLDTLVQELLADEPETSADTLALDQTVTGS